MNQKSRITHPPNRHQYGLASYMIRLSSLNIMIQRWYMFHSLYNASLDDERRMVSVIYNFQTFNIHWFRKFYLIIHIMFFSKDSFNNLIHRSHKMTSRITEIFTWLCFVGSMAILFWNSKKWNLKNLKKKNSCIAAVVQWNLAPQYYFNSRASRPHPLVSKLRRHVSWEGDIPNLIAQRISPFYSGDGLGR